MEHAGIHRIMTIAVLLLALGSCAPAVTAPGADAPVSAAGRVIDRPGELIDGGADERGADTPGEEARQRALQQLYDLAAGQPQRTRPTPADDPVGLGAQLEIAARALRNDDAGPEVWAAAGHLQQVAIRRLVHRPQWDDPVREAVADHLVGFVNYNLAAGRQLANMHPTPDYTPGEWPPPPPWRIVDPAPRAELRGLYEKSAAAVDIHWAYLAAINLIETRMGRIDGVSSAGAQGPMQFIPTTWDWVGAGNVHSDHDAIMAAGRLLEVNGAPGDMRRALLGYNNDIRYVRAVQHYAAAMKAEPDLLRGYYYWQVYIPGPDGPRLLPIGFDGR